MTSVMLNTLNIFLGTREQNVTFCVDISGSMYSSINTVKEQLIQYLLEQSVLADLNVKRLFNLIAFSTEVYPWANSMVLWQTATVNKAIDWIKDLETKTGTNTLDALLTAFQDETCHAVVLVTDDISDQEPYTVLNQVSLISRGRPVHCIYITNGREEDRSAVEFLQNLSQITRGSFKIVSVGRFGVEKITPINSNEMTTAAQITNLTLNANSTQASFSTTVTCQAPAPNQVCMTSNLFPTPLVPVQVQQKYQPSVLLPNYNYTYPKFLSEPSNYTYPSFYSYPRVLISQDGKIPSKSIAWSRYRPVKVLYDGHVVGLSLEDSKLPLPNEIAYTPDAGSLLINRTVVARSSLDGYYYKGKVLSQILAHRFMIQFGPNNHGKYKDCFYQDTAIYDIIHYDDSISHSIKTNDRCLALIDGLEKFAPAEVLEGFEARGEAKQYHASNQPLTVRFANGKTRTLPPNEAIWLPDAMHDRIKFELNLPSAARKYLEEFNDDYPNNSLPGYPTTNTTNARSQDVVMPRMVYDIWPYFVPFYPLYSNILYPAVNSFQTVNSNTSFKVPSTNVTSMAPTYYRQIRTNPASVNADTMNKSVVGTLMTPDELDIKIREQIHKNRHLIDSHYEPESSKIRMCSCKKSSYENNSHSMQMENSCSRSRCNSESYCETESTPIPCSSDGLRHQNSCHSFGNETCQNNGMSCCDSNSHDGNRHYQNYLKLVKELYDSCKQEQFSSSNKQQGCSCSHNSRNSSCFNSSLNRSKSVTFSNSHHEHECYVEEYPCDASFRCNQSVNTEVSFNKQTKKDKSKNLAHNVPDRFGNPKVHIGLPSKPLRRPRSASANLDMSMTVQSSEDLREKFRRDNAAKREQIRVEALETKAKQQELRDQHYKNLSAKLKELEAKRTENVYTKNQEKTQFKKETNAKLLQRINSSKIDVETKEQFKLAYLRDQANKRNTNHLKSVQEQALKEANRIGFKRQEQDKRNQIYHDRLLVEEAIRQTNQAQATISHNKQTKREVFREAKGQKEASLKQAVKENNSLTFKNNIYNSL